MKSPRLVLSVLALLPLLIGAGTPADAGPADARVGEVRVVYSSKGTALRGTPSALAPATATLVKGTQVTIQKVQLPWLEVRTAQGVGWVRAPETVVPTAIGRNPQPTHRTDGGGERVKSKDVAAAGRQFDSATEVNYRQTRADLARGYRLLDQMEAMTAQLDPTASIEFIVEGYLGRRGRDYALPGRLPRSPPQRTARRTPKLPGGLAKKVGGGLGKLLGGKKGEKIGKVAGKILPALLQAAQDKANQINTKFTREQEYYLGRAVMAKALAQRGFDPDMNRRMYVKQLGDAIVRLSNRVPANFGGYHFDVLNSDEINGLSGPGGFVLITRGAVMACETEAELAGILCHELAHSTRQHAEKILRKGNVMAQHHKNVVGIIGAIADVGDNRLVQGMTQWFGSAVDDMHLTASSRGYGKQLEFDADLEGTNILFEVYYDHMAMRDLLQRMGASGRGHGHGGTHASPTARAQWLTSKTTGYKPFLPREGVRESRKQRFLAMSGK